MARIKVPSNAASNILISFERNAKMQKFPYHRFAFVYVQCTPLIRHENACFITLNLQIGYHCFLTKNYTSITLFMAKWKGFVIYLNFWPKLNDLECHLSISFFGILDI